MKIVTANLGNRIDRRVHSDVDRLMGTCDILLPQEASDRHRVLEKQAEKNAWKAYYGDEPGSPATPILWNPETVHVNRRLTREILDAHHFKPHHPDPAGPDTVKAKPLNMIHVNDFGWVANFHMPASQWYKPRRRISNEAAKKIAHISTVRDHFIVGGDWNRKTWFRAFHEAHLHRTQIEVVGFYSKGLRIQSMAKLTTSSDHPAIMVVVHNEEHR